MPRARQAAERPEERIGAGADQIVEDEAGALVDDCGDHLIDLGVADGEIAFGEHGATARSQCLPEDAVVFPGPDVIRADAEGTRTEAGCQVVDEWQHVLVRRGAGVDDIIGALRSLVVRGIPQQSVELLEARDHLLAARRGVAADHMSDAGAEQLEAERAIAREVAGRIHDHRLERNIATARIDLAKGEQRPI